MLEVWHEIKVELEQENIRPVSPDFDNMMEITRILNDRAAGVSATQVCLREGRVKRKRERGLTCTFDPLQKRHLVSIIARVRNSGVR